MELSKHGVGVASDVSQSDELALAGLRSPTLPSVKGQVDEIINSVFEELREKIEDLLNERPELERLIKSFAKTVVWRLHQTP